MIGGMGMAAMGGGGSAKLAGKALKNAKGGSASLKDRSKNMLKSGGGNLAGGALNLGELLKPMTKPTEHGGYGMTRNHRMNSGQAVSMPEPPGGGLPWTWLGIGAGVLAVGGFMYWRMR